MEFISDPCVIDFTVVIYDSFGATMMLYQQLWYANSCLPHKCCQATYWQILRPAFNIQYAHIPVEPTHIQNISKSNYKASWLLSVQKSLSSFDNNDVWRCLPYLDERGKKYSKRITWGPGQSYPYGSVSAGRGKRLFRVLFFWKVEPSCCKTWHSRVYFSIVSSKLGLVDQKITSWPSVMIFYMIFI